ncbi:MAG: type II CAAX prenyl endopeptidase Rce1 family protein, partial [Acutalibacteraceae bacterium]
YPQQPAQYAAPQYPQQPAQYAAPQYPQQPAQYAAPQYPQVPGQYAAPQYPQQPGQYAAPQYQPFNYYNQYQPPMYVMAPVQPIPQPCTREARKLYRKHCSRVGLTAMADVGLMIAVQLIVIFAGMIGYSILNQMNLMPTIDSTSLYINIMMFAAGLSAIVGNLIPSSLHGRKWKIKFLDPFKGDKLKPGFIACATITALGLNFIWGMIYNLVSYYMTPEGSSTAYEGYTQYNTPPVALWLMVIWTCVIAPITEEYMFRGILMRTLSKYGATFGIVASALMFGLMHGNLAQTPMTFMIGLVMGYTAAKSGNIRQAIFIHTVNNVFATIPEIVLYYFPDTEKMLNLIYFVLESAMMIFAVVALICFAVIRSKGKKARALRIANGQAEISKEESSWANLEIPEQRMKPEFVLVKHKFLHFITSGGMIFFIVYSLLSIILSLMPNSIL